MGNGRVGFVDEGGAAVQTVLGLSLTSTSIGWVLLDGPGADATTLDHDAFDLGAGSANDGDISKHTAAVHGAQAIATASGHEVKSIGVTWTDDADAKATLLLKSLPDLGFDNVVSVRLQQATRTWAHTFGRDLGSEKCAICVVESSAVTVLIIGYGTIRTAVTQMRESADGLSRWLTEVFESNRIQPDTLFLVGSRGDLELISGSLEDTLSMPVDASEDAQLALARGAVLEMSPKAATAIDGTVSEKSVDPAPTQRWPRLRQHTRVAAKPDVLEAWTEVIKKPGRKEPVEHARTQHLSALVQDTAAVPEADVEETKTDVVEPKTDVVETKTGVVEKTEVVEKADVVEKTEVVETKAEVAESDTAVVETKTEVVEEQASEKPVDDEPAKRRSWYGPHARAGTAVVAGVIAVFVIVPTLTGQKESKSTEDRPASNSSTTSVSVHAIPSPAAVRPAPAPIHQVAAVPAPAPVPPPVALPPVGQGSTPETALGNERGARAPVVEPAEVPEEPVQAQPMVAPPAPIAPPPAAVPPAPAAAPPAAAPHVPQPAVAPGPAAAPPPPPGEPVPPPDPVMVVLGPFFGALP